MLDAANCLNIFRRRIGDTESPVTYEDLLLLGYISDAIDQVEIEFPRNVSLLITTTPGVDPDPDVSTGEFITDITLTNTDYQLYAIKAHYIITLRTKDKADRDNFRMVKGRLTLDNTNQSSDHDATLKWLDLEFKRVLYRVKNGASSISGVRVE